MHGVLMRFCAVAVMALCLVPPLARADACLLASPPGSGTPPLALIPITLRSLSRTIIPAPATDGLIHLAFAAQVTNLAHTFVTIDSILPVDPLREFRPTGVNKVIDNDGMDITGRVRLFDTTLIDGGQGTQADFKEVPSGASGMTFFNVSYADPADVPPLLANRITLTAKDSDDTIVALTNPVPVSCQPPVEISPPLAGSGWWNANGCCEVVSPHRGATLPVNGTLQVPEQFAIDYVQLRGNNTCCTGPVKQLQSWPFFGAPVYAVAPGTVVVAVNDQPEQIPGPPVGVTADTAPGNNIIEDIGNGRYVMYAHFVTGSIPGWIKIGTKLRAGQQIGQVGNSGSSTAPHLHFQVMDRPSALNSMGLPFVFHQQFVEGRVRGTAHATEKLYESGQPVDFQRIGAGWQDDRMPAEGQVFAYHVN